MRLPLRDLLNALDPNNPGGSGLTVDNDLGTRFSFGQPYDYQAFPEGRVEPGLNDATVEVTHLKPSGFAVGNSSEIEAWIETNLRGSFTVPGVKRLFYFGKQSKKKALQMIGEAQGVKKEASLAVLKDLVNIIARSIDVESHPDYKKKDNTRGPENGYEINNIIHRLYSAVEFNGNVYYVKTTVKENVVNHSPSIYHTPHSFELEDIKLEDEASRDDNALTQSAAEPLATSSSLISVANLLKGIEMSYNPGVKILEESQRMDEEQWIAEDILFRSGSEAPAAVTAPVLPSVSFATRQRLEAAQVYEQRVRT